MSFPGHVHGRVPLTRAPLLSVMFFALWHTPNFFMLPFGYVVFQLFHTGVLAIIPGLARQWTGSVYYGILAHAGVNSSPGMPADSVRSMQLTSGRPRCS